jgi:hypothetical protein
MLYSHHSNNMASAITGTPKGLVIVKASYGTSAHVVDVTKETQKMVKKDRKIDFTVGPQAFGVLDPAPGVKKTFQAQIKLNDGAPVFMKKDDGEQFVIDSPKNDEVEDNSGQIGVQFMTTIFYIMAAYIGAYLVFSSYKFGTKGLDSSVAGIIFALMTFSSTISLAMSDSKAGAAGLFAFAIAIASTQLWFAYMISLYDPNFINFQAIKDAAFEQVEQVTQ